MNTPHSSKQSPWGWASGLLAGALSALVGIACGLEPEIVLYRAFVSAVAVGIVVSIAVRVALTILERHP